MKIRTQKHSLYYFALFSFLMVSNMYFGQEIEEESAISIRAPKIDVQNIEKKNASATPPKIDFSNKQSIEYNIQDVPPTPDFQTSKLPPEQIDDLPKQKIYENYIEGAYGNLAHLWIDAYLKYGLDETKDIGLRLNHNSTSGLKDFDYLVDTDYGKTTGELFFESLEKKGKFHADAGFGLTRYNLYGSSFALENKFDSIDVDLKQKLQQFSGKVAYNTFESPFFNRLSFDADYLSDAFDSKEFKIKFLAGLDKSGYEAELFGSLFDLGGEVQFLTELSNTKFKQGLAYQYNFLQFGAVPVFKLYGEHFNFRLGASIQYLSESNNDYSKFHFFPAVEVLYKSGATFQLYAGVNGNLDLHNYQNSLENNLYLYPNQELKPTENKLNFYGGIKGNIDTRFTYLAEGGFTVADNIMFYKKHFDSLVVGGKAFDRNNTFANTYDNGTRFHISAELKYVKIENLNLGARLEYQGFTLDNTDKILNIPNFTGQLNAEYKTFNDKLTLGGQLFLVGQRTTNDYINGSTSTEPNFIYQDYKTLDSYVDVNVSASYFLRPNISLFAKGINLFNSQNQVYLYYPMQGIQFLGGVLFKF